MSIGIWQGLVDGDPDVDAVYRLLINEYPSFAQRKPIYLPRNSYCPVNSQNTFWSSGSFYLMYLPKTVNSRFSDILRGYIAQRLLWHMGLMVGFLSPAVVQRRNLHDLMKDFRDEIDMQLEIKEIVRLLDSLHLKGETIRDMRDTYRTLVREGFLEENELDAVDAWLEDLSTLCVE